MTIQIAPSLLSCDLSRIGAEIEAVEAAGADLIHVDVMDGHFVPNITIGVPVVKSLKRIATVPLDVHLMIENADRYIEAFAEAGAAMMSVHVEALKHVHEEFAERRVVRGVARDVLAVLVAAAGEQDRQVVRPMPAGVAEIAAEQHLCAVEQ